MKLDKFHKHEALDRANMLAHMVEDWVDDHPFVSARPELKAHAEEACRQLASLYQAIGAVEILE